MAYPSFYYFNVSYFNFWLNYRMNKKESSCVKSCQNKLQTIEGSLNHESGAKPGRLEHVCFIREVPGSNPGLNTFTELVTFRWFTCHTRFAGYCVWPGFFM